MSFEICNVSDLIIQHELNESSLAIQYKPGYIFKFKVAHMGSLGISLYYCDSKNRCVGSKLLDSAESCVKCTLHISDIAGDIRVEYSWLKRFFSAVDCGK